MGDAGVTGGGTMADRGRTTDQQVGESGAPAPRLRRAQRAGVSPVPVRLEALLPEDHLARLVWAAVERLDMTAFLATIKAVEGHVGQPANDPRVPLALWLYAFSQGETSARKLDRLCVEHLAYIWLCGGVSMNYHTLADFRVAHAEALDAVFTQVLARLRRAGLVALEHVAQDGMRVRASAGAASFHRQPTLEQGLAEARAVLAALHAAEHAERAAGAGGARGADPESGGDGPTPRQRSARERAARERVERLEAALAEVPAARAAKRTAQDREEARVSTTDPEARVMKMADGGFRPAYNFQLAAQVDGQLVVGAAVTNQGTDSGQALPMLAQVQERVGAPPAVWSMDGGFADHPSIDALTDRGILVLAPVPKARKADRDSHAPRPGDSAQAAAWRARMATEEAKAAYRWRAATIECVNAQARLRYGLRQLTVRGLAKARAIAVWTALTHTLLKGLAVLRVDAA